MLKTGELSKIFEIDRTSLNHYVKIGLLNPDVQDNQYYQYSFEDVIALSYIRYYRGLGFSMNQIKCLIQEADHKMKVETFDERLNAINDEIRFLKMKSRFLEHLKNSVQFFDHYRNCPVFATTEGYYFIRKEDIQDPILMDLYKMIPSNEFEAVFDDEYNVSIQSINSSQGLALKEEWIQEFEISVPEKAIYYPPETKCIVSWNVDTKHIDEQVKTGLMQVIDMCRNNGYETGNMFIGYVLINCYHADQESFDVFAQFNIKALD